MIILASAHGVSAGTAGKHAIQPPATIQATARSYLETLLAHRNSDSGHISSSEVVIGKLDSRLRLTVCDTPLSASLPAGARLSGKTTVGVRCNGSKPWTVYVPAQIVSTGHYVVAKTALQRGALITSENIELRHEKLRNMPRGYIPELESVHGKVLKRHVSTGQVLTAAMLGEALLVKKGQRVAVIAGTNGLKVSSVGIAESDAASGDRVKVRNPVSDRVIAGVVEPNGSVLADTW